MRLTRPRWPARARADLADTDHREMDSSGRFRRCTLLAVALMVGACADHPAPETAEAGSSGTPEREVQDLALQSWPSVGPTRAVILALHGFGDAGPLTFTDAAKEWTRRGIAVYAPDQRGFGANLSRMSWPGSDRLIADARDLASLVRADHPDVPLVVVGHSMGGGVALAAAADGMDADALVLAAPAIAGADTLNPFGRAGAWLLATALPDRRWSGDGVITQPPSDNVEAMRRVASDPRHFATPSSRELYGLTRLMDRAARAAPQVTQPTLTLMGDRDAFLSPRRVRRIHERIPGGAGFVQYQDGWHWLFRDRAAARVWSDVADFVLARGIE